MIGQRLGGSGTGAETATPLRIARVDVDVLAIPLEQPFAAAVGRFEAVHLLLARVLTEAGPAGLGTGFAFSAGDARVILAAIRELSGVVCGRDARRPEELWAAMATATTFLGRCGAAMSAIGVLDVAAWDCAARAAALPLWKFLGGARERIAAYGSGGSVAANDAELVAEMEAFAAAGLSAVKLKLGGGCGLRRDCERLAAVRRALGDDVRIAVDANQQWRAKEAVAAAARLAAFDLWWLEEPLPADEIEGLVEVRAKAAVPVATGESNAGPADFARMLRLGAADILMPNVQRVGGITPWRKIAAAAETLGVAVAAHVQPEVQVHLMCAVPPAIALEHVPWWPWPYEEPLAIEGGFAVPPSRPGLGVTLARDYVERYRVDG